MLTPPLEEARREKTQPDDRWVRSGCELCLNQCGIIAHRVNGKVVKIEGDPMTHNRGFVCAKGNSGMIAQSNPFRITKPLMRTNPKKGVGVDPQWKEISWDEALDTVAARLKRIHGDDPRKLYFTTFDLWDREGGLFAAWCSGFGTQYKPFSAGFFCGNNVHPIHLISSGGTDADPDPEHTKYLLLVGSQFSSVVNYNVMAGANGIAERRPGGVKIVAFDPVGSYAPSRAEEWVPIRPGTDAAVLLAIANILVNEYRIYDAEYLKRKTNAPYLIEPDGHYARDAATGKPLIWDEESGSAKPFDHPVRDYVIEGSFTVKGKACKTAFQLLKESVAKYNTKMVSEITTVPEETIRRVAKEFGEAACIGQTITIKGEVLPYRPACAVWYRGLSAHKHSFLSGLSAILLNTLVGNLDLPGGLLAGNQTTTFATPDGLMTSKMGAESFGCAYPPRKVIPPKTVDLFELFPVAVYSRPFFIKGVLEPEVFGTPYQLDTLIQTRANFAKTSVAPDIIEKVLQKIPFMVSISMEVDETAEFADIVFPDVHYLERLCISPSRHRSGEPVYFYGQRPVVPPPFTTPWGQMVNVGEILLELAERGGFIEDIYEGINHYWNLTGQYRLDPKVKHAFKEIIDRRLRSLFGQDKGLEWYLDNAVVVTEQSARQMYPGAFREARMHVYHEYMLGAGEEVRKVTGGMGLNFWQTSDYQPIPDWKPCPAYNQRSDDFDMYLVNFKVPAQPMAYSQTNSLLQPLIDKHRDDDLLINTETARRKGISDGDRISIETLQGKKAEGRARVTELIHPEVIGSQGPGGRFAKRSITVKKGVNFNDLVAFDYEHIDFVSTAIDSCIRIKIAKLSVPS